MRLRRLAQTITGNRSEHGYVPASGARNLFTRT